MTTILLYGLLAVFFFILFYFILKWGDVEAICGTFAWVLMLLAYNLR